MSEYIQSISLSYILFSETLAKFERMKIDFVTKLQIEIVNFARKSFKPLTFTLSFSIEVYIQSLNKKL